MPQIIPTIQIQADFPPKMACIMQPKRTKVFWGGRGAGRSWGCARAILLMGTQRPLRVLCARELQNSITESVHKLLSDQIDALCLGQGPGQAGFYTIQANKIYGLNGTEISFEGIKNNTNKIKSYEGIDICWVEEANKVSRTSWGVLIPTIRKEDSEIWLTFNPELETDYTYQRFVLGADDETSFVVHMTWADNPWFPEVLRKEMELDRERDPDYYANVWEGRCLQQLEGAVYARELRAAMSDGRITKVRWARETPVDTFWDLGKRDHTSIWFAQRVGMQRRVLASFQDTGMDVPYYLAQCQKMGYFYGTFYLPHDAKAKRLGTKMSVEETIRESGYKVRVLPRLSITDGINAARMMFPSCFFDEVNCEDGLQALRKYRFKIKDGQYAKEPLHDESSDYADAFRYMAIASGASRRDKASMVQALEDAAGATRDYLAGIGKKREEAARHKAGPGPQGWMR